MPSATKKPTLEQILGIVEQRLAYDRNKLAISAVRFFGPWFNPAAPQATG